MKSDVKDKAIVLDAEPHDIMDIPAASLWELCRSFDAEMGKSLKGIYSGLCVYEYFKELTKIEKVTNYEDAIRGGQ
jgi:hypothetical protein